METVVFEIIKNAKDEINAIESYTRLLSILNGKTNEIEEVPFEIDELSESQKKDLAKQIKEIIGDELNHLTKLVSNYSKITEIQIKVD